MSTLYHLAPPALQVGQILQPGHFGKAARFFVPDRLNVEFGNMKTLFWEIALETARQCVAPTAPSRLDCLFAFEDTEAALAFRRGRWASRGLYRIEPVEAGATFRGNFDHLSQDAPDSAWVDYLPSLARRYWTEPPTGKVEVLIGCEARIVAVMDPARPDRAAINT